MLFTPQARMVAAATNNLCEAANSAVQGHASEEKLISSAKQVAASTAQLLVACKVKADQDSQTMKRLQVSPGCLTPYMFTMLLPWHCTPYVVLFYTCDAFIYLPLINSHYQIQHPPNIKTQL